MKGSVYQIFIENHPNIHYVGSTMNTLEMRWQAHKDGFKKYLLDRSKIISIFPYFESLGIDNFQIRLIKEYDIIDKKHLIAYEQLWINKLKPINIQKHLYKTRHITRTLDRIDYNKNRERHLEVCKTYYANNSEVVKARVRNYREKNIEKIRERKKRTYICPCEPNNEKNYEHKSRHERTIKHQKYLQSLEETKE